MKKKVLVKGLVSVCAFLFLIGCSAKEHVPIPSFSAKPFNAEMYVPKIDNFLIVFDASISMKNKIKEETKLDIAKAIVDRMNQTIPELGQTAGLRSFGHAPEVSKAYTHLLYGMAEYSTQDLTKQFKVTRAGGLSKLDAALDEALKDFEGLSGSHNAVFIISDGLDIDEKALVSARKLKDKYGTSICLYTIHVGDAPEGKEVLQKISEIGGCGLYSGYKGLLTSAGMADFVENEFFTKKPEKVVKAAPAPVVTAVVKKDTDKDGVYDDKDQCPGTPYGAKVNVIGCWTLDDVLFDFNKSDIKPETYPMIDNVVAILKENPLMNVTLEGHTDNVGSLEYNIALSLKRADAVKAYLIKKGIAAERMKTKGFGFKRPIGLSDTEFGRSLNRRVEIRPL